MASMIVKVQGRADAIGIAQVHGARAGLLGDTYVGDVHLLPPSAHSIDKRGLTMFRVTTRFDRIKPTFHRTEETALRAMRQRIRQYYAQ